MVILSLFNDKSLGDRGVAVTATGIEIVTPNGGEASIRGGRSDLTRTTIWRINVLRGGVHITVRDDRFRGLHQRTRVVSRGMRRYCNRRWSDWKTEFEETIFDKIMDRSNAIKHSA